MEIYKHKNVFEMDKTMYKKRKQLLLQSIKTNYLFVFTSIILVVALSINCSSQPTQNPLCNIIVGFVSFFIAMFFGHYIHYACHKWNTESVYNTIVKPSFIGKIIDYLPNIFHQFIRLSIWLQDFHDQIHHDSSVNRKWQNLLIEFFMNIYVEGIALILINKLFDFRISGNKLNHAILLAWGLLYATTHIINYNIVTPVCHIQHHLNKNTNYGIDFVDIILGTKYDDIPENMNHASINILCIMILILLIKETSFNWFYVQWLIH